MIATFDGHHDLFGFIFFVLKKDQAVDATICAFLFALIGLRIDQRTGPPFKLIFIAFGEIACAIEIFRCALYVELNIWVFRPVGLYSEKELSFVPSPRGTAHTQ
ncbi:hypothetical protein SAMN05421644_1864 [Allochromatium warmingii]|uniref:Uncharacterized protein n=1 Tax=Allochromatium warmingii TaxID=61595 RepID=A0A1H3KCQ8_ALLWA|nr:hypothetical protein SAMN05421644_1864 [Allochromatium warmingii]